MAERLEPCPNPECKSTNVEFYRFMQTAASDLKYVRCLDCEMHGPIASPSEAERLWNEFMREPGPPRYIERPLSPREIAEILAAANHGFCSRWRAAGDHIKAMEKGGRSLPLKVAEAQARAYLISKKEADCA